MKRLWAVAIVALALPAFGQVRGVPASVTSLGPGRSSTPGVPASVTSLGPRGFSNHNSNGARFTQNYHSSTPAYVNNPCANAGLLIPAALGCGTMGVNNQFNNSHGRRDPRGRTGGAYPIYVPYPYMVPVIAEGDQPVAETQPEEDSFEPPAMTVFERRPTVAAPVSSAAPVNESRVYHAAPNQVAAPAAEERLAPAIVLIYKDGHQRDVQNYAIMGSYIYDIGGFVAQKIPLADLNLKATLKANDERGSDFALPAGVTP
jgi:hypothetical protein